MATPSTTHRARRPNARPAPSAIACAGRAGSCEVRVSFDRACGALATGNFGEWGAASAATMGAAGKAAIAQCEGRLPTEPCKVVTSVCSGR